LHKFEQPADNRTFLLVGD